MAWPGRCGWPTRPVPDLPTDGPGYPHRWRLPTLPIPRPGKIYIGEKAFLNRECYLEAAGDISIGAGTSVAMQVLFTASAHLSDEERRRMRRDLHDGLGPT